MNSINPTPAWQLLGFEEELLRGVCRNLLVTQHLWWGKESLEDNPGQERETSPTIWGVPAQERESVVTIWGISAFAMASMGYEQLPEPFNDCVEVGRRLVAITKNYLFGLWRDKFSFLNEEYDSAKARAELEWSSAYRQGLAVALSLGDWGSADEFLKWPGADLRRDEGLDDQTFEDNLYQIWFASRLREEPLEKSTTERKQIEAGKKLRPKMLMAATDALVAGDRIMLADYLTAYLKYYRQKMLRSNRPDSGVSLDATALWHLARRRNLGEVKIAEELMILVARPPSSQQL